MSPVMTSEVILLFMKNQLLYNFSIHRNFYLNQFINEYARKKKVKIEQSQSCGVKEFFSEIQKNLRSKNKLIKGINLLRM